MSEQVFAIIESNTVINVVVSEDNYDGGINITDLNPQPGIGWIYDGVEFTLPIEVPDEEENIPVRVRNVLTRLQFLRRFTIEERIAIRENAKVDPVLEDAMVMFESAENISIIDEDTINVVNYIASKNIIDETRVSAILSPVQS